MMKVSREGLEFIKREEGCILHVYKDSKGYPTIGVGHLLTDAEQATKKIKVDDGYIDFSEGITEEEALDILSVDIRIVENEINRDVQVELNQNQFDALASFTFNCGIGAFRTSTILKRINAQQFDQVPAAFAMWHKDKELIPRRDRETAMFMA